MRELIFLGILLFAGIALGSAWLALRGLSWRDWTKGRL